MGDEWHGLPACCHLLCKVTAALGNQGRGCTQTSTAAVGGRGGYMCMSIPAKRKERKGKKVRDQGSLLVFFYLKSKHFGLLDAVSSETKHRPHWPQEAPGLVARMSQASQKLSLGDCMCQRKCLQKLLEERSSWGKGFHSQNWAVVGDQVYGKSAKEGQEYH